MRKLIAILFLFVLCAANAADRITLTITVTNPPVTGDSLTVNSSTRVWTNATTSTTILTNLASVNNSATNLFLHIAASPFGSPRLILEWVNTNAIRLIGQVGQAVTATTNGLWATLTLSTQSGPATITAVYPFANMTGTNRTNQASHFVLGMSDYATNSFATNAQALANHMTLGIAPGGITQTATTAKVFHKFSGTNVDFITGGTMRNATLTNSAAYITNGLQSDSVYLRPTLTNGVNYGNAFRSPGTNGTSSEQYGTSALANADYSLAVGESAKATNNYTVAIGQGSLAGALYSVAVGRIASSTANSSIAIGSGSVASGGNNVAIGDGAEAVHTNSIAFGAGASTSSTNQMMLGTSSILVEVPGVLRGALTNITVKGTNTWSGDVAYTPRANTSLANGNNAGVVLGTNVYLRLSGPTLAYTNCGFASEREGSFHIIQFDNPAITCVIANDSGVEPTAANRIRTGTGGDLVLTNNPAFAELIYDATVSRWRVVTHSR